jgi:hypothetical protein
MSCSEIKAAAGAIGLFHNKILDFNARKKEGLSNAESIPAI